MKSKGLIIIIGSFILILIIAFSTGNDKEINWSKSYNEKGTNPFDLKVFHEQLDAIFTTRNIITIKETFYEHTLQHTEIDEEQNNIYINIDNSFFPDAPSENQLLDFVAEGNIAFIAAYQFSNTLLDSLKISTNSQNSFTKNSFQLSIKNKPDTLHHQPKLKYNQVYFTDSLKVNKLGNISYTIAQDSLVHKTNLISIPHKKGLFYLYTQPEVFTNYELLNMQNTNYVNQLLSLLPNTITNITEEDFIPKIYFESNVKSYKELINSPLRFIKKHKALNIAWSLLLVSIALFLLVNAKRKQRIIPIITPVKNTSLEFIETIAALYEEADNFQPIIHQKINVFYKSIRSKYNIVTNKNNTKLVQQLSLKSGYEFNKTKELIRFINVIKNRETSSIVLLQKLDKNIEDFYKNTK